MQNKFIRKFWATLYDESNKKVIGKFKDELNGKIMEEGVFLKPKQYAYKFDNEEKKNRKELKRM
jgi:hypothetical protein